ncbi:glycoside hydrolase family 127 protein [Ancylomarina sp. 16SWW S1-10-2]|uniref:glycoside hydrolase family 127 protein n=1 Tax=Ancylomarina sp. 16SWW S1-10-2 TaxID=2499681 RepID=UPI0012ADD9FF|nr:beta-L-arabinofuranosidase domain-containing protein [Ancylomarina sp. 16SWW S1-10-2]MRT91958.1 hypothetical protein [Ancylomarina sp. 16SWW S1-10-2]
MTNNIIKIGKGIVLASLCMIAQNGFSQAVANEPYINATPNSHIVAHNVDMGSVKWTNGFWADRFQLAMDSVVPAEYDYFMKESEDNFRKVAGEMKPGFGSFGTNWQDGDYYKWVEAQVAYYAIHPSADLLKRINDCAQLIASAQDEDGYITTHLQLGYGLKGPSQFKTRKFIHKEPHFSVRGYHETYNIGHLLTLACTHYKVTQSRVLLDVAIKAANCLDKAFAEVTPEKATADYNSTQIMGLVELYRCTLDHKYLDLANRFVTGKGHIKTSFYQNATPFRKENQAVGHAVTAPVLYNGAADLYAETGDTTLLKPLKNIWNDIYTRKASVTGGLGNVHDGIDPEVRNGMGSTTVHEAFGLPYSLKNADAYNETCATLYGAYFSWRMFMITGDSKYVDQMEIGFYNDLSGMSIDGTSYFYTNPLRRNGNNGDLKSMDHAKRWTNEVSCVCCPTSMVRFLTETNNYAYAVNKKSLFITLYGSNEIKTTVNGQPVALKQETNYPWDGNIAISYESAKSASFDLKLRIPNWAEDAQLMVNNQTIKVEAGTFASVNRTWKKGDKISLNLNMKPRLLVANNRVEELVNQAAVANGPLIYCAEGIDYIKPYMEFEDVMLGANSKFKVAYKDQLLGGINIITIPTIYHRTEALHKDQLYDTEVMKTRQTQMTFIPYYAWANRGVGKMSVFFPIKW